MRSSLANGAGDRHPVLPGKGEARMAKADVRNPDSTLGELMGAAIQRAVLEVFDSNKVAAATLRIDDAEFGKQMSGARRPQFDKYFAYPPLREPLIVALADMFGARITRRIDFPEQWNGQERRVRA